MSINGLMAEDLKAAGLKINFMVVEYTLGQMEGAMMENILKTKSMASEYTFGLIKRSMKVTGRMANNMARASSQTLKVSQESDCGKTVIELSGYRVQLKKSKK